MEMSIRCVQVQVQEQRKPQSELQMFRKFAEKNLLHSTTLPIWVEEHSETKSSKEVS